MGQQFISGKADSLVTQSIKPETFSHLKALVNYPIGFTCNLRIPEEVTDIVCDEAQSIWFKRKHIFFKSALSSMHSELIYSVRYTHTLLDTELLLYYF